MKLFFQYCSYGFCNSYILGAEEWQSEEILQANSAWMPKTGKANPGAASKNGRLANSILQSKTNTSYFQPNAAIIIDPCNMEKETLEKIENNNFDLKAVLVTHDHKSHIRGLRTIKRIYNVDVYAVNHSVSGHKTIMVKDGDKLNIAGFKVEVISIPGHSSDSVVYKIDNLLFTGDVLTAGLVGSTASVYGATTQMNNLRSRLLSLPGDYIVLPGHGPPSTLEAERRFNTDIFNFEKNRSKRHVYRLDL